ncbi:MAG: BamA/TamA family outer membrane protein [Steroidobacteraceae bacterium]
MTLPALSLSALLSALVLTGGQVFAAEAGSPEASFKVDVVSSNRRVARHLERYLDIQRFADFPDLQPGELRRLLGEAESNARDLLAALGYFNPVFKLTADESTGKPAGKRRIVIEVDPGAETKVTRHEIRFAAPMAADIQGAGQRQEIERDWLLRDGDTFTQEQWSNAKVAGLRVLQRLRYPTARIAESLATIDAEANSAALAITYDAGPAYRFGALKLEGVERYDAAGIRNIAQLPTGQVYSEDTLLDTQQRLMASGYFESAFLLLDSSERRPDEATVIAQLREARLQKLVFGAGYSTDTGPRLSVDHTHNQMWPLGWRAVNKAAVGTDTQSLSTNWTAMPGQTGWAWNTGLALERSDVGDIKANSLSLTGGRSRLGSRSEQRYFLQYDASNAEGGAAPASSSSLMANYSWTARRFDNRLSPTRGHGFGVDAGLGLTVTPNRDPFLRINARALQLLPFGSRNQAGKRSRIAARAEVGAIIANNGADIPARLLFLTGGDTTVRGYGYQSIGTQLPDGSIYGARYMGMASVEWQHPFTLRGDSRSFEHTIFVDAGAAADHIRDAVIHPGIGTGLRWASPVGPLQLDLAYGTKTRHWHVHLRVGFQFE